MFYLDETDIFLMKGKAKMFTKCSQELINDFHHCLSVISKVGAAPLPLSRVQCTPILLITVV